MDQNNHVLASDALNSICGIVRRFMSLYMRNAVGYMLTGSYATKQANETSDLDVLVISRYTRSIFVESYCFEGYKVQIIALPMLDIDFIIYKDAIVRKGVYLHQLATGIILKDENQTLKKMKDRCAAIYRRGPHKLSDNEILHLRGKITTRIEDLKGNSNPDDVYYIAIELYQYLIEAYFKINNKWIFSGKSAGRILKTEATDFHDLLKTAYLEIASNNTLTLIKLAENVLYPIGGELHFTSTSVCSSLVIGDYLTIYIPTSYSQGNIHLTSSLCSQFIQTMNKLAPKYNWIKLNWFYGQSSQAGIFLICHSSNKNLNEELLPKIDMFVKSLDKTTLSLQANSMEYPYLYSPLDGIKYDKAKLLLYKLIYNLQNSNIALISCNALYQLINYMWKKLNDEFEEYASNIWEDLIGLFSQNTNAYKFIYNEMPIIKQNFDYDFDRINSFKLPLEIEKYIDELMSACLYSDISFLLSTPNTQSQFLYKILQLIDSISTEADINAILKDIRLHHDRKTNDI